jgi:hypothetical protein
LIQKFKILTPIIFIVFFAHNSYAQRQRSNITHEIGFALGISSFTTDYGQRYDWNSNVGGNKLSGFGVIHYLTFTDYRYRWNHQTTYFAEHFRLRNEISYHQAPLNHYGKWIKIIGGVQGEKLRAMHGKARTWHVGTHLEYHFVDINDFGSRRDPNLKWSPYLSLGAGVNFYNPTVSTSYGDGDWKNDYDLLFKKWAGPGMADDSRGITMSATIGVGTRFKLGEYSDLFIEYRNQYFFSNWIDGLNARNDPANKFVDWLVWLHVGYVYYLN